MKTDHNSRSFSFLFILRNHLMDYLKDNCTLASCSKSYVLEKSKKPAWQPHDLKMPLELLVSHSVFIRTLHFHTHTLLSLSNICLLQQRESISR